MGRKKRRERASRFQKDLSKYTGWNRQNYFPFFHQAHQPRRSPPFLNIERKTFYFKQMEDDRKFRISEEGKVYSEILLELGCVRWSVDALGAASMYRGRTPFFRKWRCPNAILLFQVFSNSKGRFGVLSKEYFRGRKQSIFIPEGGNGEGWMNFIKRLEFFLPKPYGRVINETLIEKEGEPVKGLENPESDNESEAGVPMKLAFDPNKTIIVRRSKASDDWWLIRQAVEEKFKVMVNLRPCCGNLAVGLCATMQDAVTVCNQVMVSVGGMEVELQWWDSKFLLEKQKMVFSSGWVEIVGIPPQLRTEEIVSKIAGLCGGLVDLDGIKGMWGLHENIFVNVKGFEDGFIPVGSSINQGNVDFPLRFLRCNIMEEEDLLSEKSVNLSSLVEADLVDDMDVVSEKGEALLGDLKKAVEVDNYVTPDSLSSKQEGQEKGKSVLEEEVIAEASFFHENFGCEGKNLGRDTLLDTDLENVPLGVELLDENLENQCSSQDSFDSDHDVNSFVSTPKQSFQSYEDFQLLYDSSPILIAPEDSSPHVSASKLDFTVKAVNRVKVADAAPALIDSEFEFLEKMMSGDQGNTLERGLERGSSCSVEEMSGTHEIKEVGCCHFEKAVCCREAVISENNQLLEIDLPVCLGFLDTKLGDLVPLDSDCLDLNNGVFGDGKKTAKSLCSKDQRVALIPELKILASSLVKTPGHSECGISIPSFCSIPNNSIWSLNPFQISLPRIPHDAENGLSPSFIRYTDRGGRSIEISMPKMDLNASDQSFIDHQVDWSHSSNIPVNAMDRGNSLVDQNDILQDSHCSSQVEICVERQSDWARISNLACSMDVTLYPSEKEPPSPLTVCKKKETKEAVTPKCHSFKGMREIKGLFTNVNYEKRRAQGEGQGDKSFRC